MKKILSIIGLFIIVEARAQNPIPNPGFEEWIDYGDYIDPADWGSNNYLLAGFGLAPVQADTAAKEGNFSAKLINKGDINTVAGILCSNGMFDINTHSCQFGFPCNFPYTYFTGYAKYNPEDNDQGILSAVLWKWDTINQIRDTIGKAELILSETPGFDYFTAEFVYATFEAPDSAMIYIASSISQQPPIGSKLRVDNLQFSEFTAVEYPENLTLSVYPSPANDIVSIHISPTSEPLNLAIFDFTGRIVEQSEMTANEYRFSTKSYVPGIYYLQITNNSDKQVAGSTFEVQH